MKHLNTLAKPKCAVAKASIFDDIGNWFHDQGGDGFLDDVGNWFHDFGQKF